jgi:hypothetical protein
MIIKAETFRIIVLSWISLAILLLPLLLKYRAPYGRHTTNKWGPLMDNRLGWIIMEMPTLLLFFLLFFAGRGLNAGLMLVFPFAWGLHYINRIFIFPLITRTRGKKIPILVVILAMIFNLVNGFINGYYLGFLAPEYESSWLTDPRFIAGASLFVAGFIINQVSDHYLINLRKGGRKGYFIPDHRIFRFISCPNFAGEIMEWTGFAFMAWNLPAVSFAVWTAANLIPRAIHHHRWYLSTFTEYPKGRKAIIPGLL